MIEIGLFAAALNTTDDVRIIVANSSVYCQTIANDAPIHGGANDLVVGVAIATIERP